jgi:hypothetical protein
MKMIQNETFIVFTKENLQALTSRPDKSKVNVRYCLQDYEPEDLEGITTVQFCDKINLIKPLPSSITSITFDSYFDKEIAPGILPKNLILLDLGWYFNHKLDDTIIPASVKIIKLGHWFHELLDLTLRNLESIEVKRNYSRIVHKNILHVMPEYYRDNYDILVALTTVKLEDYQKLPDIEQPEGYDKSVTLQYMESAKVTLNKFFDEHDTYSKDNIYVHLNNEGQIVIEVQYNFWDRHTYVFVGHIESFWQTIHRHISVPKPYQLYTDVNRQGPFTLDQLIERFRG